MNNKVLTIDSMSSGLSISKEDTGERTEITRSEFIHVKDWMSSMVSKCSIEEYYKGVKVIRSGSETDSYSAVEVYIKSKHNKSKDTRMRVSIASKIYKNRETGEVKQFFYLNVEGNPTRLASGQNVKPVRFEGSDEADLTRLLRLPMLAVRKIIKHTGGKVNWSDTTLNKIKGGEVKIFNLGLDFYTGKMDEVDRNNFITILNTMLTFPMSTVSKVVGEKLKVSSTTIAELLNLKVNKYSNDDGELESLTIVKYKNDGKSQKVPIAGTTMYLKDKQTETKDTTAISSVRISTALRPDALKLKSTFDGDELVDIQEKFTELGEEEMFCRVRDFVYEQFCIDLLLTRNIITDENEIKRKLEEKKNSKLIEIANEYMAGSDINELKIKFPKRTLSEKSNELREMFGWDLKLPFLMMKIIITLRWISTADSEWLMPDISDEKRVSLIKKARSNYETIIRTIKPVISKEAITGATNAELQKVKGNSAVTRLLKYHSQA